MVDDLGDQAVLAHPERRDVILGTATLAAQLEAGRAKLEGDAQAMHDFVGLLDEFEFWFNIATP